jgi:predicted phosphoribosyltransferase
MFIDRSDAGRRLARLLEGYRGCRGIVYAIPRGGVPVAVEVARHLGMPLEVIWSKKIGHPMNPEYAIGAVSLDDRVLRDAGDVPEAYVRRETVRLRAAIADQARRLGGGRQPRSPAGQVAIVVDDGVATGSTLACTLPMLRRMRPARLVVAVPVAPPEAVAQLRAEADEVVCVLTPESFSGVGGFYDDFRQVADEEVAAMLSAVSEPRSDDPAGEVASTEPDGAV